MRVSRALAALVDRYDAEAYLRRYDAMDRRLVAAGFPPTSPWWRAELARFLRARRRRWVLRVGRRGGKSSTLCRVAVAWGVWGAWSVPPGDVAVAAFVSVDRDEAGARLRTIREILTTLGVPHDAAGDEVTLKDRRLTFRVVTANTRGTVGFTSVLAVADEMARWESRDTAANPAREVMASLRPTMATQPLAFEVCSSSPWTIDDYHAELVDLGDDSHQVVSAAPSWVANPTLTEEQTHELEPDERAWSREYAAQPTAGLSLALEPPDVEQAFATRLDSPRGLPFVAIDASSLRGDAFAFIAGHVVGAGGVRVTEVDGWGDGALRSVTQDAVVESIAARALALGATRIYADQCERSGLESAFARRGLQLVVIPWSDVSKDSAFTLLRRLMRERRLQLPDHRELRRELLGCKAQLLASGRVRYRTNGLDYLSAVVTLAHAIDQGHVRIDRPGGVDWDVNDYFRDHVAPKFHRGFIG